MIGEAGPNDADEAIGGASAPLSPRGGPISSGPSGVQPTKPAAGTGGRFSGLSSAFNHFKDDFSRGLELARATRTGLQPFWELPMISLLLTLVAWAVCVTLVTTITSIGSTGIVLAFGLTLINQFVQVFSDASLMIQVVQSKGQPARMPVKAASSAVLARDVRGALGGLVLVSWAEGVVATAVYVVRGICLAFILPFRLCLSPFVLDKTPAVDSVTQLVLALVFVTQERMTAVQAAEQAEEYFVRNVGARPSFYRTLTAVFYVSLLPIFLLGILLSSCGISYAAGWSLAFLSISVAQWGWNLTGHMLSLAHYRLLLGSDPDPYTAARDIARSAFVSSYPANNPGYKPPTAPPLPQAQQVYSPSSSRNPNQFPTQV